MDTKLKSYNRAAGWGYGLLWLLLLFSTAAAGILSSITAAFLQIYRHVIAEIAICEGEVHCRVELILTLLIHALHHGAHGVCHRLGAT